MDLTDRFRYIMKINQLTASAFADKIGVQRSSVSHVLSGRNKPSLEFIQKILENFPRVDANWLVNGSTTTSFNKDDYIPEENIFSTQQKSIAEPVTKEKVQKEEDLDSPVNAKKIERILVFYSDHTFEEYKP